MANEELYDDEFIINLTIDGTSYEEVEVNGNGSQQDDSGSDQQYRIRI